MRSLDLYSEKQLSDGSPDKIAASTAFVREANALNLAGLTKDTPVGQINSASEKKGLLSVFSGDAGDSNSTTQQRDKVARASMATFNPLLMMGMGKTFITAEMQRKEDQAQADQGVFAERMQRVIARQAFLLKEAKDKAEKSPHDGVEQINDTTVMSAMAASKKLKMSFTKDKVSIARGTTRPEAIQVKAPRDHIKENKLLKKKQFLVDYLEKFRGKLSLQEVSEVISQMEKLDKALLLMIS